MQRSLVRIEHRPRRPSLANGWFASMIRSRLSGSVEWETGPDGEAVGIFLGRLDVQRVSNRVSQCRGGSARILLPGFVHLLHALLGGEFLDLACRPSGGVTVFSTRLNLRPR